MVTPADLRLGGCQSCSSGGMELPIASMTGQRINFVTLTCVEIADSDLHLALPERVIAGLNKSLANDIISGRSSVFVDFYLKSV